MSLVVAYDENDMVKKLNELQVGSQQTFTTSETIYEENGIDIKETIEYKMLVKKTAGTQTIEVTAVVKDKSGKNTKSVKKTIQFQSDWATTIKNWCKSWF